MAATEAIYFRRSVQLDGSFFGLARAYVTPPLPLLWRCACLLAVSRFSLQGREESELYIHVRFTDKTELWWRISTRMTIEEGDLGDWATGDFKQLGVFVRNERDRSQ